MYVEHFDVCLINVIRNKVLVVPVVPVVLVVPVVPDIICRCENWSLIKHCARRIATLCKKNCNTVDENLGRFAGCAVCDHCRV